MNIQPIVEGHGEVGAVPILLRRLRDLAETYTIDVNPPIRKPRSDFLNEGQLRRAVRLALKQEDCAAVLVLFDGDSKNDCPKTDCPGIQAWAKAEAGPVACEVVMAYREYEAWFLATIESLRGKRGIREDAEPHPEPEKPAGAKGHLEARMHRGRSYSETADQPALTQSFDLATAYRRCRSFKRLVKAFGILATAAGATLPVWPPPEWENP